MQNLKAWCPWIAAIAGAGAVANGGYVLNAALNMDTSNIAVLAQAVLSLLAGLGGVGYAAKSTGGAVEPASTFEDDMAAVKHLTVSCKDYEQAEETLNTITAMVINKETKPDA